MANCCTPASTAQEKVSEAIQSPKVHLHLHTNDLAASKAFYRAFFGEEPVKEREGYVKFLPGWAPVNLALSAHEGSVPGSALSHFGIQLPNSKDVLMQLDRVQRAGMYVRVEMGVNCCHANQDKFWVKDPAGLEWEVYHLNFDLPETTPADKQTSCCSR